MDLNPTSYEGIASGCNVSIIQAGSVWSCRITAESGDRLGGPSAHGDFASVDEAQRWVESAAPKMLEVAKLRDQADRLHQTILRDIPKLAVVAP